MPKFKKDTDFLAAYKTYSKFTTHELITMLCYYKEAYKVANAESNWLDALANHLREPDNEQYQEIRITQSDKYASQQMVFNNLFE